MQSPNISTRDKTQNKNLGFTLVEILIVVAMFAALITAAIIIGVDSYQRYLIRSDLEVASSLLQKARSSAVNNIGETSHGVYFGDQIKFILFRGTSYATRNTSYDLLLDKSKNSTESGLSEVVFSPLSGTTTGGTITLNDGARSVTITINSEGGINW